MRDTSRKCTTSVSVWLLPVPGHFKASETLRVEPLTLSRRWNDGITTFWVRPLCLLVMLASQTHELILNFLRVYQQRNAHEIKQRTLSGEVRGILRPESLAQTTWYMMFTSLAPTTAVAKSIDVYRLLANVYRSFIVQLKRFMLQFIISKVCLAWRLYRRSHLTVHKVDYRSTLQALTGASNKNLCPRRMIKVRRKSV